MSAREWAKLKRVMSSEAPVSASPEFSKPKQHLRAVKDEIQHETASEDPDEDV